MRSRVMACALVFGGMSLVVACGKSEGDAQAIPRGELPSRIASLICDGRAGCCQNAGFPFDTAACKSSVAAELDQDLSGDDPTKVTYDAQAAGDCLATISPQLACGLAEDADAPACELIFRGTVPVGGECSRSRECAHSADERVFCEDVDGVPPGVCTSLSSAPHGKPGEACFFTCPEGAVCETVAPPGPAPGVPEPPTTGSATCYRDDGLFCSSSGCAPLLAVGQPCMAYEACRGEAFCDFSTQLCAAPRANGEPCLGDEECQSGSCPGAYDIEANGVCLARQSVSAEECADDFMNEPEPEPLPPEPAPGAP